MITLTGKSRPTLKDHLSNLVGKGRLAGRLPAHLRSLLVSEFGTASLGGRLSACVPSGLSVHWAGELNTQGALARSRKSHRMG